MQRIYVEISNVCNINCRFCSNDQRTKRFMSLDEFKRVVNECKKYTKYLYLHVKGEPFIHPQLGEILTICEENGLFVNITTNGTLLDFNIIEQKKIRQINVSLHAMSYVRDKEKYIFDINRLVDYVKRTRSMYLSLRLWIHDEDIMKKFNNIGFDDHVFLSIDEEFKWPSLDEDLVNERKKCLGGKQQIAILVDGTVVPCCLDSKGIINLGNVFKENLDEILLQSRFTSLVEGFRKGIAVEKLCQRCGFDGRYKGRFNLSIKRNNN